MSQGVDGCRAGWIAAFSNVEAGVWRFRFARTLPEIVDGNERPRIVAIDVPTGFADGGRSCERAARELLIGKTSSVSDTVPGGARRRLACRGQRN